MSAEISLNVRAFISPGATAYSTEPASLFVNETGILQKICAIASFVLKVAIGAFFYWLNSKVFALGFVASVMFKKSMSEGIENMKDLGRQSSLGTVALLTVAAYMHLDFSLAVLSWLCGANLGIVITKNP